jgi:hypothetical protein
MLIHERCSNCGAQLAPSRPSGMIHCDFCDANFRQRATSMGAAAPGAFGSPPPPTYPYAPPPIVTPFMPVAAATYRPQNVGLQFAVVGAVLAMSMVGGLASILMARSHSVPPRPTVARPVVPHVAEPVPTPKPKLAMDSLHDTDLSWMQETPLDAPAFSGSASDFDVVANVPWAIDIGKAWWPDAQLHAIDVDPLFRDGTMELGSPGGSLEYTFASKNCVIAAKKRAETTTNPPQNSCTLVVHVLGENNVTVSLALIASSGRAIPTPKCSLKQVFAHLDQKKKLPTRPTYRARLQADVFGHTWRISAGHGSGAMDESPELSPSFCGK